MYWKYTTSFPKNKRCNRCDIILDASTYNEIPIVVQSVKSNGNPKTNRSDKIHHSTKYLCIQCCQKIKKQILLSNSISDFCNLSESNLKKVERSNQIC